MYWWWFVNRVRCLIFKSSEIKQQTQRTNHHQHRPPELQTFPAISNFKMFISVILYSNVKQYISLHPGQGDDVIMVLIKCLETVWMGRN